MPTAEQCLAAAADAGVAWGIDPDSIEIISESENVVCRVVLGTGEPAVLRLHRPGYNTLEQLNSEVQWVQSLADAELGVPLPVATAAGDHYVTVDVGGAPHQVGVIEWVDGRPLGSPLGGNVPPSPEQYAQIGQLAARIRIHSKTWRPPSGFRRRRWDADGLLGDTPLWGRFWEAEALRPDQRELFSTARNRLSERFVSLSTGPERFGLIHADLHLGNLMADGADLTVIDFDDAGFGWFAYELAVALHLVLGEPALPELRQAIIDGYRSVHQLEDDECAEIDAFLVMRSLMLIGWLDARPEVPVYEHFEHLAAVAEGLTTCFLETGTTEGWSAD